MTGGKPFRINTAKYQRIGDKLTDILSPSGGLILGSLELD